MKAYGVKRSDGCKHSCGDEGCLDKKYRCIRGKSKKTRKNMFKVPKSSKRFQSRIEIQSNTDW